MKMRMLLLFSAVALLVGPAVASAHRRHGPTQLKLNWIYDLAENCSQSLTEDFFVEDVKDLTEGWNKCGGEFFCKVHDILHSNKEDICGQTGTKLVRYLNMYNTGRNCAKTLQGLTSSGESTQVSTLLENVQHCVRHSKLRGSKK